MALQYPGFVAPQASKTTLMDVLDQWNTGEAAGKQQRYEQDAPDQFAKSLPPLTEYGLTTSPEDLKAMFANPNTREMALAQVKEATQRRAEAMDPLRQLQLKKAQYDVNTLGQVAPTAEMRNYRMASGDPEFAKFISSKGADNAPADVKEYLWYRDNETAAGRQPLSYLEFGQAQKGSGLSVTTNPDGTVSVQQGGTGGMPKLTEGQSKDVVYLTKGAGALDTIDQYGDKLTNLPQAVGGQVPVVGNYLKDEEFQQAEQAGKEFLAAVLRKDTGAAVTKSEEDMYGAMYLPRPGDKPGVLEQKRLARTRALKAIELGVPTAAILEMERQGVQLPGGDVNGNPPPVQVTDDAGYDALPSGTLFIAPDGSTRRKP